MSGKLLAKRCETGLSAVANPEEGLVKKVGEFVERGAALHASTRSLGAVS